MGRNIYASQAVKSKVVMLFALACSIFISSLAAKSYLKQEEFLDLVIKQQNSSYDLSSKKIWLKKNLQSKLKSILHHKYPKLRLRYELIETPSGRTTVWFLDEVGKEKAISFGVSVKNDKIQVLRVLEFRESRGYEIHIAAFSDQFNFIGLNQQNRLDRTIDGITGATLSVNAMKKVARVAIILHREVISQLTTNN